MTKREFDQVTKMNHVPPTFRSGYRAACLRGQGSDFISDRAYVSKVIGKPAMSTGNKYRHIAHDRYAHGEPLLSL